MRLDSLGEVIIVLSLCAAATVSRRADAKPRGGTVDVVLSMTLGKNLFATELQNRIT
jgi:hypothetical protein